jgi:hypothetical protein
VFRSVQTDFTMIIVVSPVNHATTL